MVSVTVLTDELDRYEVFLHGATLRVMDNVAIAAEINAKKMKATARQSVRFRGRQLAPLVRTINFDVRYTRNGIEHEVGYDRVGQGLFAHVIEYGGPGSTMYGGVRNAPQLNLTKGLQMNIEDYMTGLQKAVADGLG